MGIEVAYSIAFGHLWLGQILSSEIKYEQNVRMVTNKIKKLVLVMLSEVNQIIIKIFLYDYNNQRTLDTN